MPKSKHKNQSKNLQRNHKLLLQQVIFFDGNAMALGEGRIERGEQHEPEIKLPAEIEQPAIALILCFR